MNTTYLHKLFGKAVSSKILIRTTLYNKQKGQKGVPIIQIDDFVEEESASRSTREACAHEL